MTTGSVGTYDLPGWHQHQIFISSYVVANRGLLDHAHISNEMWRFSLV